MKDEEERVSASTAWQSGAQGWGGWGQRDLQGAAHMAASEDTLVLPPAPPEGSERRFKFPVRLGPGRVGLPQLLTFLGPRLS